MKWSGIIVSILWGLVTLVISSAALAVVEVVQFDSQKQEQLYREVIDELRCVVCQNQNLADSDAPLAKDLREISAEMVRQNNNKEQIKQFMVQRYGEFVLYRPPLSAATGVLWFGPFIILFFTLVFAARFILSRQREPLEDADANIDGISKTQRLEVQALLERNHDINSNTIESIEEQ